MAVNDVDSTFKRAALFQACKRSAILSNIKFETANTDTLIELVNHNNSHSVRELPILVSKAITKTLLAVIVGRFPKLKTYINPENIQVRIEDDEMAYLIATPAKRPSSIITIVVKNIALNAIGSSIEAFKDTLLKGNAGEATNENRDIEIERISINLPQVPLNLAAPPSVISQFGSKSTKSNSSGASVKSMKRLNANNFTDSQSSSRRGSFSSNSSNSSSNSKKCVALSPTDRQPDDIPPTPSSQFNEYNDNTKNNNNDDNSNINNINNINNNIINTNNITFISNNRDDDGSGGGGDGDDVMCTEKENESADEIVAHYDIEHLDDEKTEEDAEVVDDDDLMMIDEEGEIPSSVIEASKSEGPRQLPTIVKSSPTSVDFMNLVGPHLSGLADKLRPPPKLLNIGKPNVKSEKKRNFEFLD